MKTITIEIPDEEWRELEQFWNVWNDESFSIHAGYCFRKALIRAGYATKEEANE